MSYRVLARTYRSATLDEVVGQEAIATTLKNAIASGRVHHGYLFTGTRGVGKTSMARILAKALNCLSFDAPTVTPCCKCDSCVSVAAGDDVDVIEIDAASNTGVDNIRELRSNAVLRPARSRYRVYIIDEVHMLSTGAFNALLKTLEEPPSHVKFVLATTEPHKVPATIQSRCQRFDFRAIEATAIAAHLRGILDAEGIEADDAVLRRISRLGNGSMRDALSLLDKLLSYEAKHLTTRIADEVIPPPHDELAAAVIDAVAEGDAAAALRAFDDGLQTGRTVERFCDHLIDHVRTLMLLRLCGKETDLVDVADAARPSVEAQSQHFDGPTYVYMITLLEELRRAVKSSGAARAFADAVVLRLAMSNQFTDLQQLIDSLDATGGGPPAGPAAAAPPNVGKAKKKGPSAHERVSREGATPNAPVASAPNLPPGKDPAGAAAVDERVKTKPAAEVTPEPQRLPSSEWQRIARDPVVQRIKDAVDGTLVDVRPPQREIAGEDEVAEDSADDDTPADAGDATDDQGSLFD